MIFNDLTYYLLFLIPTAIIFHRTVGSHREWVLATAGGLFFVFYSRKYLGDGWLPAACLLLFILEMATSRLYRRGSIWCVWGIVQAIAILGYFKYTNFFITSRNLVAVRLGANTWPTLQGMFLPLGISFFTFEFIHVAVDAYQGKLVPSPRSRYAAFILFFPTMVAGPIKRYQDFASKIASARFDWLLTQRGVTRILIGLTKKHALADTFSIFSDRLNTSQLFTASRLEIVAWVFSYGGKIYFDFSGYSDIAIGSSYIFGLEIPENFDYPYFRANITEFWRNWHISLYKWIVDYIFIPLGGSRGGFMRTSLNTLIAFSVSGLWHGAGLNFLLWGLWHGALLVLHRAWRQWRPRWATRGSLAWTLSSWATTFILVNLGWAFFCMDATRAFFALARIGGIR